MKILILILVSFLLLISCDSLQIQYYDMHLGTIRTIPVFQTQDEFIHKPPELWSLDKE